MYSKQKKKNKRKLGRDLNLHYNTVARYIKRYEKTI